MHQKFLKDAYIMLQNNCASDTHLKSQEDAYNVIRFRYGS